MIVWKSLKESIPPRHRHVLTVNANIEAPTIFHNIHLEEGRFILTAQENNQDGRMVHFPTHWAFMNFPKG
jgi:hypothetical protein